MQNQDVISCSTKQTPPPKHDTPSGLLVVVETRGYRCIYYEIEFLIYCRMGAQSNGASA